MGYDCAFALRGSGARVSVCGYADMGKDCVLALFGWCWCSFLSWRRDSSLGLPIQVTIEIVQLQPTDKVFDVSVVQDQPVGC